eukprot:2298501-Rhodomonas_salina.3
MPKAVGLSVSLLCEVGYCDRKVRQDSTTRIAVRRFAVRCGVLRQAGLRGVWSASPCDSQH